MRPALEYPQARVQLAGRALAQGLDEGAHRGVGPLARQHGLLEVVARRLVVLDAVLLEPVSQALVVDRRQLRAGVDDAQHLEDNALADRGIPLVDAERE